LSTTRDRVEELFEVTGGNISEMARRIGVKRSTVYYHVKRLGIGEKPLASGKSAVQRVKNYSVPKKGIKRYILTSLQNNTYIHEGVWKNLLALKEHYGAELYVSRFTYNKNAFGKLSVKPGTKDDYQADLWYDPEAVPYFNDQQIEIAPGLVWCGHMNTLPTSPDPLAGFETYTGTKSGIFPHAKIALKSVPTSKFDPAKFNYTTGTIGQLNYIKKTAGIKAEHHHAYGGLLVEVDSAGRWFVRQLHAEDNGRIYDLNLVAMNGEVRESDETVESITWGDIHALRIDPTVDELAWNPGGMLDTLKPRYQFMHDVLDFYCRNHHDTGNPHAMFRRWLDGMESVKMECEVTSEFLARASRPFCKTIVVNSNHDNALGRWLRETDYRKDPPNSVFYLELALSQYRAMQNREQFNLIEYALRLTGCPQEVVFLKPDESFVTCKGKDGGIENGIHGHNGNDGKRGSPAQLSRMGRKVNSGHTHSALLLNGLANAGVSGQLDMGYNVGGSSWSHSHIVTYRNGKRAIITMWKGKWRA